MAGDGKEIINLVIQQKAASLTGCLFYFLTALDAGGVGAGVGVVL